MARDTDRPPKYALRCPFEGHTEISVRRGWFYCAGCGRERDHDGRFNIVIDGRTNRRIDHDEFVSRWGYHVYRGRSI